MLDNCKLEKCAFVNEIDIESVTNDFSGIHLFYGVQATIVTIIKAYVVYSRLLIFVF